MPSGTPGELPKGKEQATERMPQDCGEAQEKDGRALGRRFQEDRLGVRKRPSTPRIPGHTCGEKGHKGAQCGKPKSKRNRKGDGRTVRSGGGADVSQESAAQQFGDLEPCLLGVAGILSTGSTNMSAVVWC